VKAPRSDVADPSAEVTELLSRVAELESALAEVGRSAPPVREAELRLRSLIEQASNPVFCYECVPPFSIDLPVAQQVERLYDCVLVECNDACAEAYGADSAADVVGRKLTDLFPTRPGSLDSLFTTMIHDGYRTIGGEAVQRLPEGGERHFQNNAYGVVEDGKLVRVWGTFREISDQKAVEEALRKERELTEAAWDAQRDTFFLFEPDSGKAIRWNRAFREITGYTDEEIAGMPAPASYYEPEDLERAAAFMRRLSEEDAGTIELDLICKDGRKVPTEYCASLVSDPEGRPKYVISIGRDVTERKRAEEEVRRHRERLARFMDSATESFHLVDSDLRIIEINERAMQALIGVVPGIQSKEDVAGKTLLDLYPFMRGDGGEKQFREVLGTGEPALFDDAAEHPQHGTVYMTVRAFKVGDDLGIIATDISDLKRAEAERLLLERQVQHDQKLESLGMLAGGIAHDFNNLLVGVLGGVDLALEHVAASSPAREILEDAAQAAHQAADLANQLLAYSGRGRFVVEPTDLSLLVEEMFKLVQASVSKKIRIDYELDENLPAVEVDVTQIRQVVLNLVINAAEAIGDAVGAVSLTTGSLHCSRDALVGVHLSERARAGKYVFLQVTDSGVGMDDATLKRIFDPFFTTKSVGHGLGLAAVLGIVRGHQGGITVESKPGVGTTITVLFPASEKTAVNRNTDPAAQGHWTGTGTILLVDDEEPVRAIGAAMLSRLGFDVLVAEDGRQGLEVFRRRADEIVLVVLDLAMPGLSGDEVFQEMRRIRNDVKILLSSGFDERDISDRFAAGGLAGFIHKPYRLNTLKRQIRSVLDS
jgi:PAS domain S-box-containing protein